MRNVGQLCNKAYIMLEAWSRLDVAKISINLHYNDFPIISSPDELRGEVTRKLRTCRQLLTVPARKSREIGRVGPSRHVKMVCRVGGQVGDKSCRVAVTEIEKHDMTDQRIWYGSCKNHYTDRNLVIFFDNHSFHHCKKLFKVIPTHSDEIVKSHFVTIYLTFRSGIKLRKYPDVSVSRHTLTEVTIGWSY